MCPDPYKSRNQRRGAVQAGKAQRRLVSLRLTGTGADFGKIFLPPAQEGTPGGPEHNSTEGSVPHLLSPVPFLSPPRSTAFTQCRILPLMEGALRGPS